MNRRGFIITGIKVVPIGFGFTLIPNYLQAMFNPSPEDTYDFQAWKDDFQELIKQKELHGAVQSELNSTGPFSVGMGKNSIDIGIKKVQKNLHYNKSLINKFENSYPVTPHIKLETNYGHDFKGQIFSLPKSFDYTGIFKNISKKPDNSWDYNQYTEYVTYPAFHKYIGRKAYFCYGLPCNIPQIFSCSSCGQEYAWQELYYDGISIQDKDKTYSKGFHTFYHNLACNHENNKKYGQHDGLNILTSPIDPCVCDTDIDGVENEIGN